MQPSTFDDLGVDAMLGAEIMGLLGLQPYQLDDPIVFNRIQGVMNYMKNVSDKSFFINRITTGKAVDKLQHVWSYIELMKKRELISGELADTEKSLQSFSDKLMSGQISEIEKSLASDTLKKKDSLQNDLMRIREEEMIYSK